MEKPRCGMVTVFIIVLLLGLAATLACVAAEFKRTKEEDVKLDGKLCRLPRSPAFGLGIVASFCLLAAQIIGSSAIFCCHLCLRGRKMKAITFLALSWFTFGFAIILLVVGASMNQRQPYGRGWLDGDCYVVKNGVFIGAAASGMVTVVFLLGFLVITSTSDSNPHEEEKHTIPIPTRQHLHQKHGELK